MTNDMMGKAIIIIVIVFFSWMYYDLSAMSAESIKANQDKCIKHGLIPKYHYNHISGSPFIRDITCDIKESK